MNADIIIDALGGTGKVARTCGITDAAVSQWRKNGIPRPWLQFLKTKYPKVFKKVAM